MHRVEELSIRESPAAPAFTARRSAALFARPSHRAIGGAEGFEARRPAATRSPAFPETTRGSPARIRELIEEAAMREAKTILDDCLRELRPLF